VAFHVHKCGCGRSYFGFPRDYHHYWSDNAPDTVSNPDKINEMPYAIRSALWFWLDRKVYQYGLGNGVNHVTRVTYIVNGGQMGLREREEAYLLCETVF